jgi:hypothetical protein
LIEINMENYLPKVAEAKIANKTVIQLRNILKPPPAPRICAQAVSGATRAQVVSWPGVSYSA